MVLEASMFCFCGVIYRAPFQPRNGVACDVKKGTQLERQGDWTVTFHLESLGFAQTGPTNIS